MEPTWQDILEIANQYSMNRIEYWQNDVLFSFNWWILLVTTISLVITWIIILDKKRKLEIISYGMMVTIFGDFGDMLGLSISLWGYPYTIVHMPEILEIHNIMMPILYMMVYQYFRQWKTFLIAAAVNAIIFPFILEPLLVWLQIYKLYKWKYIYSVVPYFIIAVVLKWIINKIKSTDQSYQ